MVEGYPHGLGGWGVPAIFKEAGRLRGKHGPLIAPVVRAFVFSFFLGSLLVIVPVELAVILGLGSCADPDLPPGPHLQSHHAVFHAKSNTACSLLSRLSRLSRLPTFPGKLLLQRTIYLFTVLFAIVYLAYMVYMLLVTIVVYFSSKSHVDADDDDLLSEFRSCPLIVPAEA